MGGLCVVIYGHVDNVNKETILTTLQQFIFPLESENTRGTRTYLRSSLPYKTNV